MKTKVIIGAVIGVVVAAIVACVVIFASSGNDPQTSSGYTSEQPGDSSVVKPDNSSSIGDETPTLLNFEGIGFESYACVYDGTEKSLQVTGDLPAGTKVTYTKEKGTNAGVYNATAVLSCEGYNTLELSATLTINKATMIGISLTGATSCEYDALEHSLSVLGDVPDGSTTAITYNGESVNGVVEVGVYEVRLLITNPNYNDYEASATLTIKATEELLSSVVSGENAYFQNALDGNKLYVYKNNAVSKVNNDIPQYLTEKDGILYYNSASLLSSVVKSCDGSSKGAALVELSGEWLVSDGTYLYYAVNNLLINNEQNGIYKISLSGTSGDPVRIVKNKAKYLAVCGGEIYYSNSDDGGKLYCVSSTASELSAGTLVYDEKAEYIISDGTYVYFNSTNTIAGVGIAAAIRKYKPASGECVKLTTDSGKYLTKIDNYIYYVNDDLLTEHLYGDGIYKVSAALTSDSNASGTNVLSCEDNGYYSLASDGKKLFYYKLNNKHFYSYEIETGEEKDLMAGFTPVEEEVTPSMYASLFEYKGEIYYTDPRDGGCLYKYNKNADAKYKVLSNSVSNVYFNGNYMYYSTYVLTQYALWRMDLTTKESVKISTSRCDNLIFDGEYIYYIKVGSTYNNKIMKMGLDGSNPEVVYEERNLWVKSLEKKGNVFYFTTNPALGYKYAYAYDTETKKESNLDLNSTVITIDGDNLYYYDKGGNSIGCYNLVSKSKTTLVSSVDVNDMKVLGGKLYYSSMSSANKGFFSYDFTSKKTSRISNSCAHGMISVGGDIYYIRASVDYVTDYPTMSNGDGRLCRYDGKEEKQL